MLARHILITAAALVLSACGHTSMDNEMTGQAKKLTHETPLICPDYIAFDLSLGVMQNGTGSMSTQDIWFVVRNVQDFERLKAAVEAGKIVKVKYNELRGFSAFCVYDHEMTGFSLVGQ